jgi:cysteine synthase
MIDALEDQGKITTGKTALIEPTSGNLVIGLEFVVAARMPETMSMERRKILTHLGAGMPVAVECATNSQRRRSTPSFPANPLVHEKTTAEEIWKDSHR